MDQETWKQFAAEPGEGSFEPVYEATKARVWGASRRVLRDDEDALDAFQSAYARLIGMARRGELLADDAAPLKLVVSLAVREADSLRKRRWRRGRREIAVENAAASPDPAASPAQQAAEDELRARILAEAGAPPDRLRSLDLRWHARGNAPPSRSPARRAALACTPLRPSRGPPERGHLFLMPRLGERPGGLGAEGRRDPLARLNFYHPFPVRL